MSILITAIIFAAAVIVDQISKYLVVSNMTIGQSVDLIPGVFRFTYIRNDGAAFGKFGDIRWLFMSLSLVAVIGIIYVILRYRKKIAKLPIVALTLIAAGGFSNMIDRCFFGDSFLNGTVIDFLDFCAFPNLWSYIFNIADSCVVVGAFIFLIYYVVDEIKQAKAKKSKTDQNDNGNETL